MHNASKVLMGATQSSFATVENRAGEIAAGKIVRLASDDSISVEEGDGAAIGISLGRDLSNTARTAVCVRGVKVPVLVTSMATVVIGAQVAIHDTTGLAADKDGSSTYVNAVYVSEVLEGVDEDGADCDVALISFPGGL